MNHNLFTDVRIRRSSLADVGVSLLISFAILCFIFVAQNLDDHADAEIEKIAHAEHARLAELRDQRRAIVMAYENGRRDALLKTCPTTALKGGI